MSPAVESMVAVTYVRDIAAARSLYELLGFREHSEGRAETSAWLAMEHGSHSILLTSTRPSLDLPQLPLLFYFFYDDLEAVLADLETAGVEVVRLGRAPHAEGGEARVADPDGNTILLGQRQRPATAASGAEPGTSRFSLLRESAAAVAAGGGPGTGCQVIEPDGRPCQALAEVRLADPAGTAIWACISHAEEVLVMVPGAFVASEGDGGIAGFLARRHG